MTAVFRLLPVACLLSVPVAAQTLNDAFARMDRAAQQFRAVEAGIKRDNHTAIIDEDSYDTGVFRLKRDKGDVKMLIDFIGPDAKMVSLAGSNASIYNPKINTVQVYDIGAKKGLVEQFLLLGFGATSTELKAAYDVMLAGVEKTGDQQTWHLTLVPKGGDIQHQMKQAELWVSQNTGLPVQQKVLFANGDYWLVNYSDLKFNPPLSDDSLKLKTKKGAVVEHPQL
jgi:outer membrane lipoprotein-sorting protein